MTQAPDSGDSVFSKIIRGEIPAQRVYEDDKTIAIMDINPLAEGHVLVIPKEPAETMDRLSDDAAAALGRVLPRITRAVMAVTGCASCNILQNNGAEAGQSVFHVHVHVIPRFPGLDAEPTGAGLRTDWRPAESDADALAELGRQIARKL